MCTQPYIPTQVFIEAGEVSFHTEDVVVEEEPLAGPLLLRTVVVASLVGEHLVVARTLVEGVMRLVTMLFVRFVVNIITRLGIVDIALTLNMQDPVLALLRRFMQINPLHLMRIGF